LTHEHFQGTLCPFQLLFSLRKTYHVHSRFADLFHPKLPILRSININAIYQSSQLLFWSIISIVASYTTVPSFAGLSEPFQDMVRTEILQAPLPLQKIQALLLLCTWPMPVTKQVSPPDSLFSCMNIACRHSQSLRHSLRIHSICICSRPPADIPLSRSRSIRAGCTVVSL
jgi:hypothetical protein